MLLQGAIHQEIHVDGKTYSTRIARRLCLSPDAHRLVVVSHLPNSASEKILYTCIQSIKRFTPEPHELWIVDNNSPPEHLGLLSDSRTVNIILNRTEPIPPNTSEDAQSSRQLEWGSYANAIGLELALRVIESNTRYLMTLHMDSLPTHPSWLSFLTSQLSAGVERQGKLERGIAAAGVRMDKTRSPDGILHVLGCLVDFQVFRSLSLSFFPELPAFDVGDKVTIGLREAGYGVFACRNTLWEPELEEEIHYRSPWRSVPVDRSLDSQGRVIFCHLGRGVRKAVGSVSKGIGISEWLEVAHRNLIIDHR